MEATSHKAVDVRTPTTHLENTSKVDECYTQDTAGEVRVSS